MGVPEEAEQAHGDVIGGAVGQVMGTLWSIMGTLAVHEEFMGELWPQQVSPEWLLVSRWCQEDKLGAKQSRSRVGQWALPHLPITVSKAATPERKPLFT